MKILTVCSTRLGSSIINQLNIEKALKELGVTGHSDLGSVNKGDADVIFVGRDIADAAMDLGDVVVLNSLIDMNEIKEKLAEALKRHGMDVPQGGQAA